MKKTLIALSLAALSSAAVADVTLYGQIKAGVETFRTKTKVGGETTKSHTVTEIADFGSRIGFKGHESLGNGVNAIWKLEQKASVAGNSTGWATREGYIGVETTGGTVRAGKLPTTLNDMGAVDQWEYANPALGLGQFTRTGERLVSVRYDSPVVAGFSGSVQFAPRDNQNADDKGKHKAVTQAAYYAGLNYANAGFFAQYGFGLKKNNALDKKGAYADGKAHRLEGGYNANNLFVGVGLQYTDGWDRAENGNATTRTATKEATVSAAYTFGNVTPKVTYAHGWDEKDKVAGKTVRNTKYDQVIVGADYDFSKRTTAFVQAGWARVGEGYGRTTAGVEVKNSATTTAGLVGLRHKF